MWETEIKDDLRQIVGQSVIVSRTLKVIGLSEARVDELVSPLLASQNPSIGIYARASGIELRLTAKAADENSAAASISPLEDQIRSVLGECIWGTDDDNFANAIGELMLTRGLTLAIMESCTGGLLASLITDVPGSSAYFRGGLVAYSNELKEMFGVDKSLIENCGAVSSDVAEAMAQAARIKLSANIGIGITGVAGPDELEGKSVGTIFVCVTDGINTKTSQSAFQQHRMRIKHRAAMQALTQLRLLLLDSEATSI